MSTPKGQTVSSGPAPGGGGGLGHIIFRLGFVRADSGKFVELIEEGTRT